MYFDLVKEYAYPNFILLCIFFFVLLQRHYNQLREEIAKMKPPEGLEDEEGGESIDPQGVHFSTDSALSSAMNSSQLAVIENLITDSNSNSVLEDGFC